MSQQNWDKYFIEMAMHVASKSKDPSTKVGCVIVGPDNEIRSTGYNGFPRGVTETVNAAEHQCKEIQKSFAGNGYLAACTCGDMIQIEGRKGNWDILEDPFKASDPEEVKHAIMSHPHFTQAPEMELHPERWERPLKYDFVEHAERNAVYHAARVGIPIAGCRAYLNWEPYPCKECAKAFIQAGIIEVIGPDIEFPNHKRTDDSGENQWEAGDVWKFSVSQTLMDEAGVEYRRVPWEK